MKKLHKPIRKVFIDRLNAEVVCQKPAPNISLVRSHFEMKNIEPISAGNIISRLQPEQIQELIDDLQEYLQLQDDSQFFL